MKTDSLHQFTEFADCYSIVAEIVQRPTRADKSAEDAGFCAGSTHYRVKVYYSHKPEIFYYLWYSQGPAIKDPPTISDILWCVQSDCSGVGFGQTFEEWCEEMGADTDSRKAERTYNACVAQGTNMEDFLGHAPTGAWQEFLSLIEE